MGNPYISVAVSGYNTNPPADDGSATAANTVFWSTIKTKLPDPLKTAIETMNTNVIAATAKLFGGAGVTSTAVDYTVSGSDQGKLVRATAAGVTITTPDATAVLSPFVFGILDNSSGIITLKGNGSQTVDGNASLSIPAGSGTVLFTDGTNWFSTGIQGTLVGKQLSSGEIINATIAEANATNAVTFSLKTLAGTDPSAADPVLLCFRSVTAGSGSYVYRTVTAALSLTISSGSTMGFSSGIPGKLWIVLFDDAGTIRLGAINCLSGSNIYPLGRMPIASSMAEGGAGGADSAQIFYTGTAVTSKPFLILAYASYETGIATAGSWNASPTNLHLFSHNTPYPGSIIQTSVATGTTAATTTSATMAALTNTLTNSISLTSAANINRIFSCGSVQESTNTTMYVQLARGTTLIGNPVASIAGNSSLTTMPVAWVTYDAPGVTTSTQYKFYGQTSAGTLSFPPASSGVTIEIQELMT